MFSALRVSRRDVEFFESCHLTAMQAVDPERSNGEVTICLPAEVQQWVMGELSATVNLVMVTRCVAITFQIHSVKSSMVINII